MADVQHKTAVNTRASLASRLPKKTANVPHAGTSLHQKAETTYDATYTAAPADVETRATGLRAADAGGAPSSQSFAEEEATQQRGYRAQYHPSSEWQSAAHAATRNVKPEQQLDFYSTARKVEQMDDDRRGGLVGSTQRSLEIRTKRAEDAALRPAAATFTQSQRRTTPSAVAEERHGAKGNYLDLVECTHLKPRTEEQIGFSDAPLERLPGDTLSQELAVQSKVISEMGTSRDFFRGSPKYLHDTPVGYAGHVPMAERNVSAIHHGDDAQRLFAKSHMTLAEHGGGAGLPTSGTRVVTSRRRGNTTQVQKALPPKSAEAINQTAEGRMQQMSLYGTLERERQINVRDDAKSQNYF